MNAPRLARALSLAAATTAAAAAAATTSLAPAAHAQTTADIPRLTEAEVVATAVDTNPSLKVSILELESARLAILAEEARYAFVLTVNGGFTRSASPGSRPGESYSVDGGAELSKQLIWGTDIALSIGNNWQLDRSGRQTEEGGTLYPGPDYGLYAQLSVVQPLLRGSGRAIGEASILAAKVRRTSAEHARDSTSSELLRSVLTAYWELWYANATMGIQDQSRVVTIRQRDDAAARVNAGSLAPADLLAFETRVATRDEDILNAQVEVQRRQTELAQQLGVMRGDNANGLPSEQEPPSPPPLLGDAEADALAQSPQIKQLQTSLELARLQARTADDPQRARLDLDAYVKAQGLGNDDVGAAWKQIGTFGAVSAHVGLTFQTPLDDRGRRAAAARAHIAVDIAAQRLVEARQGITSDVRIAVTREAAARKKVALAEETARIAQKQLEAEEARFQSGASTPLTVLQAEDQARSAKLRVARAKADLLQANLTLQNLTGKLLVRYASVAPRATAQRALPKRAGLRPMVGSF